ncbi:hypothetical protein EUX98_g8410 [Antrodiella citrinella]|uniref:Uncharacterized protein n=1 Tax=Antrodiella citrinella TaxID=2447956 RepID=A0A4S4M876_9APHY|nr:hypothetical protein EUX98_g8410 [Antrodiella citrinella]
MQNDFINLNYCDTFSFPIFTRSIAIVTDVLVLVITWMKTAHLRSTIMVVSDRPRMSILRVLILDGTLYFIALFTLNTVTLLLDVLVSDGLGSGFIIVNDAISATLISRFILNLRSVYVPDDSVGGPLSSVYFTDGDFVTPLGVSSAWENSSGGDIEHESA